MVKMPDTVIRNMRPTKGYATKQEIVNAYIENGYGPEKAKKWLSTYLNTGFLEICGERDENGLSKITCVWWLS